MTQLTLKSGQQVKLGRIRPQAITETEHHIVRVSQDGTVRVIPKLGMFYKAEKDATPPPDNVDWTAKGMPSINRMYLNDTYGDCVIAGKGHIEGVASGNDQSAPVLATDAEILAAYHAICGPGDNGCDITTVLNWWQTNGLTFNGVTKKIDGWVAIDWTNQNLVKVALEVFGNITLGINLPQAWTCTNCVWDVPTGSGAQIVGGHDVPGFSYGSAPAPISAVASGKTGVTISTWAGLVLITWEAFLSKQWIEEAYVCLPQDWYSSDKIAPNGIDDVTLKAMLKQSPGGWTVPPVGPPLPPGPPPPAPPPSLPPMAITLTGDFPTLFGSHKVTLTGTGTFQTAHMAGLNITIPPWLLRLLKLACASSGALPAPWNMIAGVVCGLLPANHEQMAAAEQSVGITLPPWVIWILRFGCQVENNGANLPQPWQTIVGFLCGQLPSSMASPCGGCK